MILALISHSPHMLSRSELELEIVQPAGAELPELGAAIANLAAAGLVNVCGELVGTTRATRYMNQLLGGSL